MPQQEMIFSDYLRVILKRKWIVFLVTALVVLCTYSWAGRKKPLYSSIARIKIQRVQTFADLFSEAIVSSGDPLENYMYEITSQRVLERAAKAISTDGPHTDAAALAGAVKAKRIENTDLMDIETSGPTADIAQRICQAVVVSFISNHDEMISKNTREEYEDIQKSLTNTMNNLASLDTELREKLGDRALIDTEYDQGKVLTTRLIDERIALQTLRDEDNYTEAYPEIVAKKNAIKAIETNLKDVSQIELEGQSMLRQYNQKKKILEEMVSYLTKRLEEARIAQTKKMERIEIIDTATPGRKITTARAYLTAVGGLLGLMLGIVFAFVAESLDTSIRTLAEIEETFKLPILGIIPHFSLRTTEVPIKAENFWDRIRYSQTLNSATIVWRTFWPVISRKRKQAGYSHLRSRTLVVPFSPRAPATEGYRAIRTHLQLAAGDGKIGALLMTSAGPGEGKSTTIVNLAFAFAQAGQKTLLVGGNMRRPTLYKILGLNRELGLSDILTGEASWRETVKDHRDLAIGDKSEENLATVPGAENLFFITCGGRTIQPAELLSLPAFEAMVREWEAEFDIVLIDGTPLLPVPDSVIMSSAIGNVILVYQIGVSQRGSMQHAVSLVRNTGAKISGLILNDLRASWATSPDYYHYRTYYGRPEEK